LTVAKDNAHKQADERQAAGKLEKLKESEAEVQRHTQKLEMISVQLRLLGSGGALMLEAPVGSEPSSGSTKLSVAAGNLDERIAAVEDREEKVRERVEEYGRTGLISWIYGSCDTLVCYVKKRMSIPQRILYVLSKNPKPSPIEFAKQYMEITNIERCCKAGKAAFDSCKAAHKEFDKNFKFNSLSKSEQKEYKKICDSSSDSSIVSNAPQMIFSRFMALRQSIPPSQRPR
jgi:hypothetical protein